MRNSIIWITILLLVIILLPLSGCKTTTSSVKDTGQLMSDLPATAPGSADDLMIVDCLLPGQIRRLGTAITYLTPRRAIKTTALDCRIRGGEYVAHDRSDYDASLKFWLKQAEKNKDKVAQTYVGEIYEKGLGRELDYALAAEWYQKAAKQGDVRAQINLGHLYEKGLGVPEDIEKALNLYRKASGLKKAITLDTASINVAMQQKLNELRNELKRRKEHSEVLQQKVDKTKEDLERTRQALEQTKAKTETERQKLKEAKEQLEKQKKQAASTGDSTKQKNLEDQLRQREADFEKQKKEISALNKEVVELNAKAQGLEKSRLQLEKTQLELDQKKSETEKERKKLEQTRQQLEKAQRDLEQKIREAEIELKKLEEGQRELEKQKKQAETAGDSTKQKNLEDQLRQREVELENQRKEITEFRQEIATSDIKAKNLEQTRQQLVKTQKELEQKKIETETERKKLEETQQQLEKVQRELVRKKEDAGIVRQKYDEALKELEKERNQAAGSLAKLKSLEEQLKGHKAEWERKESELSKLKEKVADLESKEVLNKKLLDDLREREKKAEIAGPTITMVDPKITLTRDIPTIQTPSGTQRLIEGEVTAPAGLYLFTINNREEKLDVNGKFKVPVLVQQTNVPVKIVATDKRGKEAVVVFQLTPDKPAKKKKKLFSRKIFGNYYAIIIGNEEYKHWSKLKTPKKDANKMAEVLESKYGFKTIVLLNATRHTIIKALYDLEKELTENDNLLIFYAGHGQLVKGIGVYGRGYWVPCEGEIDNPANWINTFEITDLLSLMKSRHILVVSDSCYSGAFITRGMNIDTGLSESEKARRHLIEKLAKKKSRNILSSGDLQPVIDDGGSGHSVFAKAVLDALRENDEVLEGFRLHKQVQARVAFAASNRMIEQIPQYAPLKASNHEMGEFFFVPN